MTSQNEVALKDYDHVLSMDPQNVDALFNRGVLYCDLERYSDAVSDFSEALKHNPKNVHAYFYRAKAHEALGKKKHAQLDYKIAAQLDPELTSIMQANKSN